MLMTKDPLGREDHMSIIVSSPEKTSIEIICRECGNQTSLTLSTSAINRWIDGEYVQNVFSDLDAATRELLVSGTCGTCWDEMWGLEEDE